MRLFKIIILIFMLMDSAYSYTKKTYSNYNRTTGYYFLKGLFYEQVGNSELSISNFERSLTKTEEESINLNIAVENQKAGNTEESINQLIELNSKGYSLGRYGIYLYMHYKDNQELIKADEILDKMIKDLQQDNDVEFSSALFLQKFRDKKYNFNNTEEVSDYIDKILMNELLPVYRLYFLLFKMQLSDDPEIIQNIIEEVEDFDRETPYIFYSYVFQNYLDMKEFDHAFDILKRMEKFTLGDVNYFLDRSKYYLAKKEFVNARNIILKGLRDFYRTDQEVKISNAQNFTIWQILRGPVEIFYNELIDIYLQMNDLHSSTILIEKIDRKFQGNPEVMKLFATKLSDQKLIREAMEIYSEILKDFPDDVGLLNNYAYLLAQNDMELNKALGFIDRALEKEPEIISYLDTKAWILFKMGEYEKAEKIMENLFSDKDSFYHPSSEELFLHYREIKIKLNKAEALNELSLNKTALKLSRIFNKNELILQTEY